MRNPGAGLYSFQAIIPRSWINLIGPERWLVLAPSRRLGATRPYSGSGTVPNAAGYSGSP